MGLIKMKRGISLVEVVIAVSILSMFLLPMFTALHTNHKGTAILKEEVNAILLALEVVDQVKLIPMEYLNGFNKKELKDGEQPLWTYFKTTPFYNVVKSHASQLKKIKAILYLKLSPLPKGYKRILKIDKKNGIFTKFSVTISYSIKDMKRRVKKKTLTISDILFKGE